MDLSQIKMVVSDMDGTLLNSNHEVSALFFELFEKLRERNILFVAASGRQYHSIIDKLEPIKDEIVVIAENGGFALQNGNVLVSTPLENRAKERVLDLLAQIENIHPVLCGKDKAYIRNDSKAFENKLKEYYAEYEVLDSLSGHQAEILKIAIYHNESSEKYIYPKVAHLEGELKVKVSGENWVDISSPDAHKGHALKKVQELNGISPEETMVFGDYNNDLEMMALAKFSFAMENAHPNVKEAANYLTTNNDNFGVERILEQLINAR
ncbi:HAD family hydrolase [Pseudozobellia thermophila]|nr:HAD family hydrolase [Pseudozobellia thermophila]